MSKKIKIDNSRMENMGYGNKMAVQLKEIYAGKNILDVKYNYFAECFDFILDSGEILHLDFDGV